MSLSSTMNIALSSLQASQTALSTVSHNISNTNTDGYSRQEVMISSQSLGGFGGGVQIDSIRRVVDNMLQLNITNQTSRVEYAKTTQNYLSNLEVQFGQLGSSSSMEKLVQKMFSDLANVASTPDSTSLRLNAVKSIGMVVDNIRAMSTSLSSLQSGIDQKLDEEMAVVNTSLKRIADLNSEIMSLQVSGSAGGSNSNDLQDARRREIDTVSARLGITLSQDEMGRIRVSSETGRRLADSGYVELERIAGTPFDDIGARAFKMDGTPAANAFPLIMGNITTGSLKALTDVRDVEIPKISAQLDEFAKQLIDHVNSLSSQGTGVPPQQTVTTGNGFKLSGVGADLVTELGLVPGSSFDLSVVTAATGAKISTTLAAGGGTTSITIPAGPFTLTDLANLINANADVSSDLTASVVLDADGYPQLQIQANSATDAVVFGNRSGNPLGLLGMNNFFKGTDASTIEIRSAFVANPSLLATARMRASDGGVSFNDNRNVIPLSQLSDTSLSFSAAGGLPAQTGTLSDYYINISSGLAVSIKNQTDKQQFAESLMADLKERNSSTSGVNMDEELSNMMLFQHSYQASARILTVVDELFKTLVNLF